MKRTFARMTPALALWPLLLSLGCGPSPEVGSVEEAETLPNGVTLNGVTLNGVTVNGVTLNGVTLNGITVNGRRLNRNEYLAQVERRGATLGGSRLSPLGTNGGLTATAPDGSHLSGGDLIGTVLVAETNQGRTMQLRIEDASSDDTPGNDDVTLYSASWRADQGWISLCVDEHGRPSPAVAVPGRWNLGTGPSGGAHVQDPSVFTFGCVDDAIGKCARLGYKTWQSALEPYHEACTRLIRADYCGDGVSHTIDGTTIDLWDRLGIQTDTEPSWHFEAEWEPDGARCVTHQRVVNSSIVPGCVAREISPTCGSPFDFWTGTLLMDRYEVQPR